MAFDFDKMFGQVGDDQELDLGAAGKVKAGELKSFFAERNREIQSRDQRLQTLEPEVTRLRKFEQDTASVFTRLNQMPLDEPVARAAAADPNLDEFDKTYGNDPLLGDFAKKYRTKLTKELKEEFMGEIRPTIEALNARNDQLTRFSLLERNQRDFKEAGDWPEGWNYQKAQKYAEEKNYWVPGGQPYGVADIGRIHSEVTEPIRRSKFEDDVRAKAREEALEALRKEGVAFTMPNRSMGGGAKPVEVKGRNGEEIIGNAISQAAQDMETRRMLEGLRG